MKPYKKRRSIIDKVNRLHTLMLSFIEQYVEQNGSLSYTKEEGRYSMNYVIRLSIIGDKYKVYTDYGWNSSYSAKYEERCDITDLGLEELIMIVKQAKCKRK